MKINLLLFGLEETGKIKIPPKKLPCFLYFIKKMVNSSHLNLDI